jgi:hypothetical protein
VSRTSALGQFTLLPVLADAADITAVGTTMADRIEKYVNMRFASTAARDAAITSPEEGMCAYIDSDDVAEGPTLYNGAAWRLPWNMPWGFVGHQSTTAAQNGVTTPLALVSNISVTFTAIGNRQYLISGQVVGRQRTSAQLITVDLFESTAAASLTGSLVGQTIGIDNYTTINTSVVHTPSSGSRTYRVRAATSGATVDLNAIGYSNITVTDIGPAAGTPA